MTEDRELLLQRVLSAIAEGDESVDELLDEQVQLDVSFLTQADLLEIFFDLEDVVYFIEAYRRIRNVWPSELENWTITALSDTKRFRPDTVVKFIGNLDTADRPSSREFLDAIEGALLSDEPATRSWARTIILEHAEPGDERVARIVASCGENEPLEKRTFLAGMLASRGFPLPPQLVSDTDRALLSDNRVVVENALWAFCKRSVSPGVEQLDRFLSVRAPSEIVSVACRVAAMRAEDAFPYAVECLKSDDIFRHAPAAVILALLGQQDGKIAELVVQLLNNSHVYDVDGGRLPASSIALSPSLAGKNVDIRIRQTPVSLVRALAQLAPVGFEAANSHLLSVVSTYYWEYQLELLDGVERIGCMNPQVQKIISGLIDSAKEQRVRMRAKEVLNQLASRT